MEYDVFHQSPTHAIAIHLSNISGLTASILVLTNNKPKVRTMNQANRVIVKQYVRDSVT